MDLPAYDRIGRGYSQHRAADPRIVGRLAQMLGPPENGAVVDVGAGTGNYAAALAGRGYQVVAVEPSATMRDQAENVPGVRWVDAMAEQLSLPNGCAGGVVCVLALHHFLGPEAALSEMRRVVGGGPIIIFTFDPRVGEPFWFAEYFPKLWHQAHRTFPPLGEVVELVERATGRGIEVSEFPLPHDLQDGFAAAGWRRPETYLDAGARAAMSCFALADRSVVEDGLRRLRRDLDSGAWRKRHGSLLGREEFDAGYRFLSTGRGS
ncbi:MAG: class I SAM-dependent methyltransferase [Actinomycetota bacterium]|nr:class I SAM-dependent methyltransferase [Actinomycetota bacterium]